MTGVRDGMFLKYLTEASTGRGRTRTATEILRFQKQPDGSFHVQVEAEQVCRELYEVAYGDPIVVDVSCVAATGVPLQFHGLCPMYVPLAQRALDAQVVWPWDGAGVQLMPPEPDEQLTMAGSISGPTDWQNWRVWRLREVGGAPPGTAVPIAYYGTESGFLVGVEYGATLPGMGRFIYCDAVLKDRNIENV